MDYIRKFKELRLQDKLTQVELSKKLGLSPSAYGLYETRQRQMDIDTLIKLCKLFKVSSDDILGLTDMKDTCPRAKK